jgi:hypothetical protein
MVILTKPQKDKIRRVLIEAKRRYNREEPNEGHDYAYDELALFGPYTRAFVRNLLRMNVAYFDGRAKVKIPTTAGRKRR